MSRNIPSVYVSHETQICQVLKHVGHFYIVSTPTDYEPGRYQADNKRVFIYTHLDDAIAALLYMFLKKYKPDGSSVMERLLLEYRGYKILTLTPSMDTTYYLDERPNGVSIRLPYLIDASYSNPPTALEFVHPPSWNTKLIQECYSKNFPASLFTSSLEENRPSGHPVTYLEFLERIQREFDNRCDFCCDIRSGISLHRKHLIDEPKICVSKNGTPIVMSTRPLDPKNSHKKYLLIPPNHTLPTMTSYNSTNNTYSGADQYYGLHQRNPQKAEELYEFLVAAVFAASKIAYYQTNQLHTLFKIAYPTQSNLVFLWLHATSNTVPHLHIHMTYSKSLEEFQGDRRLYPDYIHEDHVDIRTFCLMACGKPLSGNYSNLSAMIVQSSRPMDQAYALVKSNILECINEQQAEQNKKLVLYPTREYGARLVSARIGTQVAMNRFHLSSSGHLKLLTKFHHWVLSDQVEYRDILRDVVDRNSGITGGSSSYRRAEDIWQRAHLLEESDVMA